MTDLPALLARVEAARGPDREIDAAIFCVLCCTRENTDSDMMELINAGRYNDVICKMVGSGAGWVAFPPLYTSSLDATVALVEKVRPNWNVVSGHSWMLSSTHPSTFPNYICEMEPRPQGTFRTFAYGHTEPLSRLVALLRSMIEEEEEEEEERK